jgi:hypothetical protein
MVLSFVFDVLDLIEYGISQDCKYSALGLEEVAFEPYKT